MEKRQVFDWIFTWRCNENECLKWMDMLKNLHIRIQINFIQYRWWSVIRKVENPFESDWELKMYWIACFSSL